MAALKTGELARQAGVNLQTIRYYERQGLLPRPARTQAGYRMFAPETVGRVRFIKRAQELGFSLREIRALLALRVDGRTSCAEVRRRAQAKAADVEKKIRALEEIRAALERLTAACSGRGPVGECPILQFLDSGGER
jgi:MerR family mercuric resistance operon transcriptional regulator